MSTLLARAAGVPEHILNQVGLSGHQLRAATKAIANLRVRVASFTRSNEDVIMLPCA